MLKIYYCAQVSTQSAAVYLLVQRAEVDSASYKRFIENVIRRTSISKVSR